MMETSLIAIARAATAKPDLDEALAPVQAALGVETGDYAGMHFSDDGAAWRAAGPSRRLSMMLDYIGAEIRLAAAEEERERAPLVIKPREETEAERAGRSILEPLGFRDEMGGGGSVHLSRYMPNGRYIWATASDGCGLPEPGDFCLCAYEAESDMDILLDVRRGPDDRQPLALSLQEAAAACLAVAEIDPRPMGTLFSLLPDHVWTHADQRAAQSNGWELNECGDGQIVIVADTDGSAFTGERMHVEAFEHVTSYAEAMPAATPYHELCQRALALVQASEAAVAAEFFRDAVAAVADVAETDVQGDTLSVYLSDGRAFEARCSLITSEANERRK